MNIGRHPIGPGHPVFILAELSGNAGKDFDKAVRLVYEAHKAGADAVKTQCFTPDSMTLDCDAEPFCIVWNGQERTLYDLYSETAMPMDWHPKLKDLCESLGMEYFASVFSPQDADFMEALDVPAYKIASFELTDLPLIRYVASKGKPVILSTGMATENEVDTADKAANEAYGSSHERIILKCVSAYPASIVDSNLRSLSDWVSFGDIVGLSDHTLSIVPPVVAVSLGAVLIEKHLCLSRADGGPDAAFSLEPDEFAQMVKAVRGTEKALGEVRYGPTEAEIQMLRYRRSLFATKDIAEGEKFTTDNVRSIRPGNGLPPDAIGKVMGNRAMRDIRRGTPLAWEMVGE